MTSWNQVTGSDSSPGTAGSSVIQIEWAERVTGSKLFLTTDGRLTGSKSGTGFNIGVLYIDVRPRNSEEYWEPTLTGSQIERLRSLCKEIPTKQSITVISESEQLGTLVAGMLNNSRG